MTKAIGFKYPEYLYYLPKPPNNKPVWKGFFCRRIRNEGREQQMKELRLKIKHEQKVSNDMSWVMVCDLMPPLMRRPLPEHEELKAQYTQPTGFNPPNTIADITEVANQPTLTLYEQMKWAFEHSRVKGISPKDAPNTGAYEFLCLLHDDRKLFMTKFLDLDKRNAKETGRDWIKDDDELADLLEGLVKELRAPGTEEGLRLPVDGSADTPGEPAIPPAIASDLPGESRPSETDQTGVQAGLPVLG